MQITYYILDVFTQQQFSGNPLAVFLLPTPLSGVQMQKIAAEMNLSETVFIGEQAGVNSWPVHIFTPKGELPFAGHPTVGAAVLLKQLGMLTAMTDSLVLKQQAGDVSVYFSDQQPLQARFRAPQSACIESSVLNTQQVQDMLGLEAEDIVAEPVIAGCGVPYQIVELASRDAVSRAQLDLSAWRKYLQGQLVPDLCIFSMGGAQADIRMRMFAPACGIVEDPATGSAAAGLAAWLASEQRGDRWLIEQGVEMGRSSLIGTQVKVGEGGALQVEVYGSAVRVAQGQLRLL